MTPTTGGIYTLLIKVPDCTTLTIGALGQITFEVGWYAYVGSALGSGGFSRIERHRELAAGNRETRHWHIDYLLGHPNSRVGSIVTTEGIDGECRVAERLDCEQIPAFGCSDCSCNSHLFYERTHESLLAAVEAAHELVRDDENRP